MENFFHTELSSVEIFVLAGLLGYESVPGVTDSKSVLVSDNVKKTVRHTVRRLERKRIFRYELDGTLYIRTEIKKLIDCVCAADIMTLLTSNMRAGKKEVLYIFRNKDSISTIADAGNNKYRMTVYNKADISQIIPEKILNCINYEICESMLFEEAEIIKGSLTSFNTDHANQILDKVLQKKNHSKLVSKILTGECTFISVLVCKKHNLLYSRIYDTFIAMNDSTAVEVKADEFNVLSFDTVELSNLLKNLNSAIIGN